MKKVEFGPLVVELRHNDIIHASLKEDFEDIDLETMKKFTEVLKDLGAGTKLKVLIEIKSFNTMTEEAKKYSASEESQKYTKANAIVINSFAAKLSANFFIKFNKPSRPTRIFNTVDEAIEWLNLIP
jgi:hypothetical protein